MLCNISRYLKIQNFASENHIKNHGPLPSYGINIFDEKTVCCSTAFHFYIILLSNFFNFITVGVQVNASKYLLMELTSGLADAWIDCIWKNKPFWRWFYIGNGKSFLITSEH